MGRQQLTAFEDNNTEQWFDAEEIEEIDLTSLIPRDGWLEFQKPESKIEKRGHTKINSLLSQNPVGWDSIINSHSNSNDGKVYMPQISAHQKIILNLLIPSMTIGMSDYTNHIKVVIKIHSI